MKDGAALLPGVMHSRRPWRESPMGLFLREPKARVGLFLVSIIILGAVFAPVIAPYSPRAFFETLRPPGAQHLMGTDHIGRDVLSMIIWGTRTSLQFAFGASALALVLGVILGALPGFYGGILDDIMSRFFEIFLMIPRLFLIILVVALFGSGVIFAVAIIGLTIWPSNAKLMRAQVFTLRERGFVHAALVSRTPPLKTLFFHIVPNGIGPVIANSTLLMAQAVLLEAGLSFLGLGDPNVTSWGKILHDGQSYIASAGWIVLFPGLALVILLLSLHLIGDALMASQQRSVRMHGSERP